MKQDFFTKLPSEIIIDILSRLPVRTIISCKCVCKSLLTLVGTREFADSHLSKSIPGLATLHSELINYYCFKKLKIYEVNDVLDLERHELHYDQLAEFYLPFHGWIHGSVNGLLFLSSGSCYSGLHICNPVTREYIKLQCPQEVFPPYRNASSGLGSSRRPHHPYEVSYGFGASKMTNQYKVVGIFYDSKHDSKQSELESVPKVECQVYTLGTRSWRRTEPPPPCKYAGWDIGVFVNGNLHWLVNDLKGSCVICCFDVETELFSTFSFPRLPPDIKPPLVLCTLSDFLCLSDNTSDNDFVIWMMKEYGFEKSWTKEYVIQKRRCCDGECSEIIRPIKVFKDGDLLASWIDYYLFYYSNKTKTTREIKLFSLPDAAAVDSISLTVSFLSLKIFSLENVESI